MRSMSPQEHSKHNPSGTNTMERVDNDEKRMMSLQEENEQLRETVERLRLLQQTKESPSRRNNMWNYREWLSSSQYDHDLVPQDDFALVEMNAINTHSGGLGGLHRRSLESSSLTIPTPTVDDVDIEHAQPFTLKAKRSDVESPGSPRSICSDESWLNEHPLEDECHAHSIEDESFVKSIADRAGWLVGLLILQSCSSFILSSNETLLKSHIVLVQFLTMLVGAGGNAGNQASVRVIRGLAVGSVRNDNIRSFLWSEFRMGICLSLILGVVGCIRAAIFMVPLAETMAITVSLLMIVMISILIGATLPLVMHFVNIDPAHSSTTIQVLMDILGVTITCLVSGALLNSSLGKMLSPDLYADANDADSM